jgi:glycolate oxidase iron-sulfur subunit
MVIEGSGCCGAIKHHLADTAGGLDDARRNIDAWWPLVSAGEIEAIVVNASGCGVMVKDYGHHFADDPVYAEKAAQVSRLTKDPIEFLESLLPALSETLAQRRHRSESTPPSQWSATLASLDRVAFHPPCTLQHGLKIRGAVEKLLSTLGATLVPVADSHLCCGSAGTYSVLQPTLSQTLKQRKLAALEQQTPQVILSANVGCITHLQSGTETPVAHWVEWVDARLS